ncbi:restriction endonuclease subunit S [Vibrio vulnificus]|nr:restriction endonuclease subunit S [Vibrio vulnificus]
MSELPKGWVETDFGNVIDSITNGISDKQNKESNGIPVSRIETIADQTINYSKIGFVDNYDDEKAKKYLLNEGDILFSHINSPIHLGKTAIFDGRKELFHGTNLLRIVVNKRVTLSSYFNYYCKFTRAIGAFSLNAQHAVNQSSLNQKKIKAFSIPLAPLAEQKRIVEKLDEVLAQVDTIKARLDGIPALLKRFRQSVLASAVSGKLIDVKAPNLKTIGNVSEDIRYGTSKKCDYKGGSTPVIRIPNIGDRKLDTSDLKSADFTEKELEKLALKAGDLLVIRSNGSLELVAKPALVEPQYEGFLYAGYLIRIRCDREKIIPSFLLNVLSSRVVRDVVEMGARSTSGVNNINSKELSALEFVLPSLEEQKEIVRLVDQYFAFAETIEAQVKKAQARVDNLTQSILAKAFRGELVPQDPNDEPADKLLERIAQARKEAEALAKAAKKAGATKKKAAKSA